MTALASLVTSFAALLVPDPGNHARLRQWITDARAVDLPHVHSFTRGLDLDIQAATAALTLPHHNGRTEGVNTKTKMIKRQMYGRAGFTLLRHRILLGLSHIRSPPKVRQSRYLDRPKWAAQRTSPGPAEPRVVAVDGKTSRGSGLDNNGTASGGNPAVFSPLSPLPVPLLYQAPRPCHGR